MAKGKGGRNKEKGKKYLSSRTRIKNKTQKLLSRIKNLNEGAKEKILKVCKIGRKREG